MVVCPVRRRVYVLDAELSVVRCYCLDTSFLVRTMGRGRGEGDGELCLGRRRGGACITPLGTLLVADSYNNRVVEMDLDSDGAHFSRLIGEGVLEEPFAMDCNTALIAVSQPYWDDRHVALFSMVDGSLVATLGRYALGVDSVAYPWKLCLLADGSGVAVTDGHWDADDARGVVVLGLDGHAKWEKRGLFGPLCLCDGGTALLVADPRGILTKLRVCDGSVVESSTGLRAFGPSDTVCLLADGVLVAGRDGADPSFQVFTSLTVRMAWIACVVVVGRR